MMPPRKSTNAVQRRRLSSVRAALAAALALATTTIPALAQSPTPRPLNIPTAANPAEVEATIARAAQDLASAPSASARKGAVMLLAKYPNNPAAHTALLAALDDAEPIVRRAAVVSLVENIQRLHGDSAARLMAALGDDDPEVRKSVAAVLPQLLVQRIQSRGFFPSPPNPANPAPDKVPDPTDWVFRALADSERDVRLDALEALRYTARNLSPAVFRPLLNDPDFQVRVTAHEQAATLLTANAFIDLLAASFPDPDPRIQSIQSKLLLGNLNGTALPILRAMLQSPLPDVQLNARIGLFALEPFAPLPDALHSALSSGALDKLQSDTLLNAFRNLPADAARAVTAAILDAENPQLRTQAAQIWLATFFNEAPPVEPLVRMLNDASPSLRNLPFSFFQSRRAAPPPAFLDAIAEAPHVDSRIRAFVLASDLDPAARNAFLLSLLPDPSPEVRRLVLIEFARTPPPNWQSLFFASLRDPDPSVRQTAANALLRQLGPEGLQVAQRFVTTFPDQPAARLLKGRIPLPPAP